MKHLWHYIGVLFSVRVLLCESLDFKSIILIVLGVKSQANVYVQHTSSMISRFALITARKPVRVYYGLVVSSSRFKFWIFLFSGLGSNVTIIIQANDGVAGQVGFDERSRSIVVREGGQVYLSVNRTLSVGRVSVDWRLTGDNASLDFVSVNGTVTFNEVSILSDSKD